MECLSLPIVSSLRFLSSLLEFGKGAGACRIILGPPKHVFHLVCIVLGISTAIKTALKVTDRLFKWSINGSKQF